MAKEKKGEEVDTRGVSSRDCEYGGSICFHLSHALCMAKEKR
jgi:hypothetical protein